MSKVYLEDSVLTDIADAIRAKTGGSASITPANMATEIGTISGGGDDFPTINLSTSIEYLDYNGEWDSVIKKYGDKLITSNLIYIDRAFHNAGIDDLSNITLNINSSAGTFSGSNCFFNCQSLKKLPKIGNQVTVMSLVINSIFSKCFSLREIPQDWATKLELNTEGTKTSMFSQCYSLREIPQQWLTKINSTSVQSTKGHYYYLFYFCTSLDEILNLNPNTRIAYSSNHFGNTFDHCNRLKRLTFKLNNEAPYNVSWKNQIIDLSVYIGYFKIDYKTHILNYNSGITADKEVTDAASYELLKNDPDWFTGNIAYSRYNHSSAVETINSLPDTSAYGTNTIKFKGDSGSATDGGAINTLTAEEIAVATAKGWTVTLS